VCTLPGATGSWPWQVQEARGDGSRLAAAVAKLDAAVAAVDRRLEEGLKGLTASLVSSRTPRTDTHKSPR
jgi:hypothetical protein